MNKEEGKSCTVRSVKKIDVDSYKKPAELISALSNGTRIAILHTIMEYNEVCTCELESALGIPQPTVTAHLHKLYEKGLLKKREEWKYTYYSINPKYTELIRTILGL